MNAGEKLDQARRFSGGSWRSKNRPPETNLTKPTGEGVFCEIPEGCTQWSYRHECGERFRSRGKASGK